MKDEYFLLISSSCTSFDYLDNAALVHRTCVRLSYGLMEVSYELSHDCQVAYSTLTGEQWLNQYNMIFNS